MKVSPLIRAVQFHNAERKGTGTEFEYRLVHTGQHYDSAMSDIFFRELRIAPPDINLEVGSGSHAAQTADVMTRFETVCIQEQPEWVIVVGDVNPTMACTLVCSKMGIKVAHVEAGLRSFDRTMPEEINRIVTDSLADLLLTPSCDANENLIREGVSRDRIAFVGNIMIDALVENLDQAKQSRILNDLEFEPKKFVYVTLHRPSNVDCEASLRLLFEELNRLSLQIPIVFPIHPRTRKMCERYGISIDGIPKIKTLEPIGYHDSLCLAKHARFVLTDSGGLQEETTYFRTPCLTLRPNTERPVTITVGSNKLTCPEELQRDINGLLNRESRFGEIPELWDGRTAGRVVESLISQTSSGTTFGN